ncbi:hypothetical protein [Streptomyces regalis]|uniref:Nitroreductase domain-containing protein n=1 Tax=Streptomyces regalis TaxID=68262 RepID=A0A101J6I0_9ACTN|nr:hypothetical protein [Streptomyces regalis]KUL21119.1 hypothetical protein ADL12_45645 [Streptomyces regalis]
MSVSYESLGRASHVRPGRASLHLARAASLAPSPHNSQPWLFAAEDHDHGFEVHLHGGRRMLLTDPGGGVGPMTRAVQLANVVEAAEGNANTM